MRLEVTFYCNILLCLCIGVSNGAPPKEAHAGTSNRRMKRYTAEEDKFIVDELVQLVDVKKTNNIWSKLTDQHYEKWKAKSQGFPQERSLSSLRNRFWGVLIHNLPQAKVKVPESFKMKLNKANLNKKTEDAGSSKTSLRHGRIDHQEIEELSDDAWATNMVHELEDNADDTDTAQELQNDAEVDKRSSSNTRFTKAEDNFIFDELSLHHNDNLNIHSKYVWRQIAGNYCRKWKERTEGFTKERSARNLYDRFRYLLTSNNQPDRVEVPENLAQIFNNIKSGEHATVLRFTSQEDKFIIKELLKPSLTNLYGSSTLESIRAEHDIKRKAKFPGFENARTLRSLRGRIDILKNNGLFPKEIMDKLSERQGALPIPLDAGSGESSRTHTSQRTDAETDEMIEELLNNTQYHVDFSNDYIYL